MTSSVSWHRAVRCSIRRTRPSLRAKRKRVRRNSTAILERMLSGKLREFGVVGAGGAGFPTYVKAQAQVEFMIANGAECEPLIHKDAVLMRHFPEEILRGMTLMIDAVGARSGKFGVKTKNAESIEALERHL